jgi:hypothetical protein
MRSAPLSALGAEPEAMNLSAVARGSMTINVAAGILLAAPGVCSRNVQNVRNYGMAMSLGITAAVEVDKHHLIVDASEGHS